MKAAVIDSVIGGSDDAEVFARAREVGFSGVEITLTSEDLYASPVQRLDGVRRAILESGLEVHALVLGEHNEAGGIADESVDRARRAQDEVRQAIAWARELGAEVVLVPFFMRSELASDADVERAVASFRSLCPAAGQRGVTLCYEGTLRAEEIQSLVARVDSDAFACYFDLANPLAKRGLDVPTEIRALGGLIRRVHVKDTRVAAGDCRPGTGRVNFAECARALAEIEYDGWLTLETPPAPPPLVARDLSFTRSVFGNLGCGPAWPRLGAFTRDFGPGEWEPLADTFLGLGLGATQLDGALLAESLDDPSAALEGRAVLEARGLRIAGLGGYRNLIAPDPAIRAANIDHVRRCLELAPVLGTYVVATETGTMNSQGDWSDSPLNSTEAAWSLLYEALETLLPVAEQAGTILALEAHVKHVLRTRGQVEELVDRFPTEYLQIVCDPYNYVSAGLVAGHEAATETLLDRFEHRFVLAHLKDVDAAGAEVGTPEFGTGVFSQRPYLDFLRTRRPDLALIAEHLPLEHVVDVRRRIEEFVAEGADQEVRRPSSTIASARESGSGSGGAEVHRLH
jgi:sugar phosphate isomerase/epimerase